jgi:hypothetical protein
MGLKRRPSDEWFNDYADGRPVLTGHRIGIAITALIGVVVGYLAWSNGNEHGARLPSLFLCILFALGLSFAGYGVVNLIDKWRQARYAAGRPPLSSGSLYLVVIAGAILVFILVGAITVFMLSP